MPEGRWRLRAVAAAPRPGPLSVSCCQPGEGSAGGAPGSRGGHRAAPCSHLGDPLGNHLCQHSVRLRCEGIWIRKQTSWVDTVLGEERGKHIVFSQWGPGTAMPSGCHPPRGTFTRDRKLCPTLSHRFSPVPGAWGRSSLSCAQAQAPSPDAGAAPQPQQGCTHQARLSSHPGAGTCPTMEV